MGDHDLLLQLTEGIKYLQQDMAVVKADIKELKENTSKRVDALEREKADKTEVVKVQDATSKDIDMLKTRINIAIGVVALAMFVIPLIVSFIVHGK